MSESTRTDVNDFQVSAVEESWLTEVLTGSKGSGPGGSFEDESAWRKTFQLAH